MAEISSTNKRRRKECLHISDLPNNAVAHVASYLSNISRALFAIASPSASKSTILSSDEKLWETLDFGIIDKRLAGKLKDNDIRGILLSIDAANNTKFIKLAGCISIDGSGLSPLRNSIVLKQLDLGLVSQYSETVVTPILASIINTYGSSLTHLQLPKRWRIVGSIKLYMSIKEGESKRSSIVGINGFRDEFYTHVKPWVAERVISMKYTELEAVKGLVDGFEEVFNDWEKYDCDEHDVMFYTGVCRRLIELARSKFMKRRRIRMRS